MTSQIEHAILLSSDKLVRNFAGKQQIEVHGIFWIFDEVVKKIVSKTTAASKLRKLL